ncbi:AMP-binding protein [Catenulispora subtropica]|uniref:AMP-dependent synthetase/ligase domain-containing protein n=1 Tax=Catenulispora subtropica TaxID=450798 RepID=A0ABN2T3S0_9ACTN
MMLEAHSPLIHELVAEHAARQPDAVALSLGDTTATYQRLHFVADGFAAKMRTHGVRPGEVVAVLMHRTPRLVVALLAVLRAGAAYLALDPEDSEARHAELVRGAGVRFLVSDLEDGLPVGLKVLTPETPVAEGATDPGAPNQTSDSPAYISYSADQSAGTPVSHRALAEFVTRPNGLVLGADASAVALWAPLVRGGHLAMADMPALTGR